MPQETTQRPIHEINTGRFERRIIKSDCWMWQSSYRVHVNRNGESKKTPLIKVLGYDRVNRIMSARRYAWERQYGVLPSETDTQYRLNVINICGNDMCVKPDPDHNKPVPVYEPLGDDSVRVGRPKKEHSKKLVIKSEEDLLNGR